MKNDEYVLVASLNPLDVFTTLFFSNGLEQPHPIRIVQYGRGDLGAALAGASALVVIRGLFEFGDLVEAARALRVPTFYFVDDNFIVLRDHPGPHARFVQQYSADRVRDALPGFAGVLLSSRTLSDYFAEMNLHPRLLLFPPIAASRSAAREPHDDGHLRVAFFGGLHLHEVFLERVLPAIRRLAREQPLSLMTMGMEPIAPSKGLSVSDRPYQPSYAVAVEAMTAAGVNVLLHPVADGLANNRYKNPHALITAHAIGAVPVVSNLAPYDALADDGVALRCENSEESWYRALVQAGQGADYRAALLTRLADYCARHFDGRQNRQIVAAILSESAHPGRWLVQRRRALASVVLARRLARRLSSRLTGRAGLAATVDLA